jgi:hypothetical protein
MSGSEASIVPRHGFQEEIHAAYWPQQSQHEQSEEALATPLRFGAGKAEEDEATARETGPPVVSEDQREENEEGEEEEVTPESTEQSTEEVFGRGKSVPTDKSVQTCANVQKQRSKVKRDDAGWEAQLAKLKAYKRMHGDCSVPQQWAEDPSLGSWVNNQRRGKRLLDRGEPSRGMTAARAAQLEALGVTDEEISKQREDKRVSYKKSYKKSYKRVSSKKCEDCAVKYKNYGLAEEGYRKRWCGACAKENHPGAVKQSRQPAKIRKPDQQMAQQKKAKNRAQQIQLHHRQQRQPRAHAGPSSEPGHPAGQPKPRGTSPSLGEAGISQGPKRVQKRGLKSLCEDCRVVSKNFGLAAENYRARWCAKCSLNHGPDVGRGPRERRRVRDGAHGAGSAWSDDKKKDLRALAMAWAWRMMAAGILHRAAQRQLR